MKKQYLILTTIFLTLPACGRFAGDVTSIPFWIVDTVVVVGTLGTLDPGMEKTVKSLVAKGELESGARLRAPSTALISTVGGVAAGVVDSRNNTSYMANPSLTNSQVGSSRYRNSSTYSQPISRQNTTQLQTDNTPTSQSMYGAGKGCRIVPGEKEPSEPHAPDFKYMSKTICE